MPNLLTTGGHAASLDEAAVYAQMLRELDGDTLGEWNDQACWRNQKHRDDVGSGNRRSGAGYSWRWPRDIVEKPWAYSSSVFAWVWRFQRCKKEDKMKAILEIAVISAIMLAIVGILYFFYLLVGWKMGFHKPYRLKRLNLKPEVYTYSVVTYLLFSLVLFMTFMILLNVLLVLKTTFA